MSNHKKPIFQRTAIASLISVMASAGQAATVTDTIDYQYFRDFAENKGKFAVGASNIEVIDKKGVSRGTLFADGTPMPDWSMTSSNNGVAHLIDPQYIASVKHNSGYTLVQFGETQLNRHPEANFNYLLVDRNNKPASGDNGKETDRDDYHIPRLHKLVTETATIPVLRVDDWKVLQDRKRFPHIVRNGAGAHWLRPSEGDDTHLADPYAYLIGGNIMNGINVQNNGVLHIGSPNRQDAVNTSSYGPLPTITVGGDSGSPVLAYDAEQQQWVAIAVHRAGNRANGNWVVLHQNDFIDEKIKEDHITIDNKVKDARINWLANGKTSTITSPHDTNLRQTVNLRDESLANPNDVRSHPDLNHGQSIHFTGESATLRLGGDIHQGAGALHFHNNMTVIGSRHNATWLGAGVNVAQDKTVDWQVHNPQGDRLSKIGQGTLNVSGSGENLGDISVGDGTVLLNQKADSSGKKQAFNQVHITSGRGTVVLGDSQQVNPDKIVFGYRGGRLDLNGNDIHFNQIRNVDAGGKIVNHNANQKATVLLTPSLTLPMITDPSQVVFETNRSPTHQPIGLYKNTYPDGHIDYYLLKEGAVPSAFLPNSKGASTGAWEFIAGNRDEAIRIYTERENKRRANLANHIYQGQLGENTTQNPQLTNGEMDFVYRPNHDTGVFVLSGDVHLNGNVSVENGKVLLSGTPVPHAYNHQKKQDVVLDDEWINRQFIAKTFEIKNNATLATSRNVAQMSGNVLASQNAVVQLGAVSGETENCYRSDYTGKVYCDKSAVAEVNQVKLKVAGDVKVTDNAHASVHNAQILGAMNAHQQAKITLKNNADIPTGIVLHDQSQLHLNNTQTPLTVSVSGSRKSQMVLHENSHWQMPNSTQIGHLDGKSGSQITLNASPTPSTPSEFKQLILNGDLSGNIQFNHLTDLAQGKADTLTVHGYATGSHTLSVQNTGAEAQVAELDLVALKHGGQRQEDVDFQLKNGFVDAGAWRYTLKNDPTHRYYLFNEKKSGEIQAKKEADAKKAEADAQKAKQDLLDAIEARKQAEEALKQLQANIGANANDLAILQQQADDAKKLAQQARAEKEKAENELANIRQQLSDAQTAKNQADGEKALAQQNLQAALDTKKELENQLTQAMLDKNQAEQAKNQAQSDLQKAIDDKNQADTARTQAQTALQNALDAQKQAESEKQQVQTELANINRQKQELEQQLGQLNDTQTAQQQNMTQLRERLDLLNQQLSDKQKALTDALIAEDLAKQAQNHAETLKIQAEQQLNQANADLLLANRLKDEANAKATQAEQNTQSLTQQLNQAQVQLSQANADKANAEQKQQEAELARQNAEKIQQDLQRIQANQAQALQDAQNAQKLAEDEAKKQAELVKQAQADKLKAEEDK
ncbi:S6 family peptidase, partial [Moraxella oblonga]|uniref:S6 family peptidase n=1 Tax=Moraxella oblonga TaxID=200413 RepID=UPI00082C75DB